MVTLGLLMASGLVYAFSFGVWWPASVAFLVLALVMWKPVRDRVPAIRKEPAGDWTPFFDPELPRVGEAEPGSDRGIHGLIVPYEARVLQGSVTAAAVIGAFALVTGLQGPQWSMLGIGVFLLGAAARTYRGSLDRGSYIALAQSGIYSRLLGDRAFVPWGHVANVRLTHRYRQPFIRVEVTAEGAVQRSGQNFVLAAVERALTGRDLVLGVKGLTLSPERVVSLAQHYLAHPDARRTLESTLSEATAPSDIQRR